jgi:hypothetical protein
MAKAPACLMMRDDVVADTWLWVEYKVRGCTESFVSVVVSMVDVSVGNMVSLVRASAASVLYHYDLRFSHASRAL